MPLRVSFVPFVHSFPYDFIVTLTVKFHLKSAKISYIIGQKGAVKIRKLSVLLIVLLMASDIASAISFNRIIYPIKTKDASGDILEQMQPPARIISIDPAVTEILFNLNLKDKIVGITENCNYPDDAKNITKVGKDSVDINKVVALKPDLVLVNYESQKNDMERMRRTMLPPASPEAQPAPIQVFAVDPHSLQDIYDSISVIGTVTNKEHSAYSLLQKMKRRVDWVEARAKKEKKIKALVLLKKRPLTFAGQGSYLYDLSEKAGFDNAAPRGGIYVKMKRGDIEKADPDIIITSLDVARDPKNIYNDRNFRRTSAGKNKKVICINEEMFSRPGPRVTQVLEEMATFAYGWGREIEQIKE